MTVFDPVEKLFVEKRKNNFSKTFNFWGDKFQIDISSAVADSRAIIMTFDIFRIWVQNSIVQEAINGKNPPLYYCFVHQVLEKHWSQVITDWKKASYLFQFYALKVYTREWKKHFLTAQFFWEKGEPPASSHLLQLTCRRAIVIK